MRMLLMISNNNMSMRELFTMVFDNHPAGWGTSFMSGLPSAIEGIVSGYDAIAYEIGRADDPARVATVQTLLKAGATVLTHVEGRDVAERESQLRTSGAFLVSTPVNQQHIVEAMDQLTASVRARGTGRHRVGVRERFRRFLGG
jgi:hypothetical protein